jgi:hypothetical protein
MSVIRRLLRTPAWPARRLVEPRFADVNRRVDSTKQAVHEESTITRELLREQSAGLEEALNSFGLASTESITYVGRELRGLHQDVVDLVGHLGDIRAGLDGAAAFERRVEELIDSGGAHLDATTARLLNFAESASGSTRR